MPYLDVSGLRSYHEITGAGEPLLLLHGGFCSIETMRAMSGELTPSYLVHAPERAAHGRTPDHGRPFDYGAMVDETLAYLDAVGLSDAHVVGFSDGAIIGLLLARDHPGRVRSLVTISGNLDPSGFVTENRTPSAAWQAASAQIDREYDELSPDGPEHAPVVTERLMALWTQQPQIAPASLAGVTARTLVMAGDRDSISTEHTLTIASAVPDAQLCIVPGASHLLVVERPALVGRVVHDFLQERP
ncbi:MULTISPECIES: alpha/beta fold hydrolase [unclassified Nocardioides]|uniref:alpha/beta fold hydrolase n=1 Tax=unclassified Nocardioides TaxID=2615069 RepID=UPI003014870F